MELNGKKVLVVGLGRSGIGVTRFCASLGAKVVATDRRSEKELGDVAKSLSEIATLELGGHSGEIFKNAELIVVSPGVPELPEIAAAKKRGIPIIGELELSARFVKGQVLAVTGTNGKSTTTSLLGAMLSASGRPTFTGGNLGVPLVEALGSEAAGQSGTVVLEVSSFQLETVEQFKAHVALLLNLSEDHLDRYASYTDYVAAKARIFERQTARDFAVVNGETEQSECYALAREKSNALVLSFRLERGKGVSAWIEDHHFIVQLPDHPLERIPLSCFKLPGRHNLQNALAALLAARLAGAKIDACQTALEEFDGLAHRMQFVGELGGVKFFNDSKATNVGSVMGSLTGFEYPVVLIAGGKDKGGDYRALLSLVGSVVREVILIGAAADRIAQTLEGHLPLHRAKDLDDAVKKGAAIARAGEALVLSPACSSFDMFHNFEERGQVFAEAVKRLGARR